MTVGQAVAGAAPLKCRLCGKLVAPDALGLFECGCGWGGPEDPLETSRGLSRSYLRFERGLANTQARNELLRIKERGDAASRLSWLYEFTLALFSTAIYALLFGSLALSVWFTIVLLRAQSWIGAALVAILAFALIDTLFGRQQRPKGIEMPLDRLTALASAVDAIRERVGAPRPHIVVLVPEARFFVYQRHPVKRFFRRELVMGVGVAGVTVLNDLEVQAILAHELAHFAYGQTVIALYTGHALASTRHLLDLALGEIRSLDRRTRITSRNYRGGMSGVAVAGTFISWTLLLPFRFLWTCLHLLRLRQSRTAEYAADAAAVRLFGSALFDSALTNLVMTQRTLRGARQSLAAELRRDKSGNYFEVLRRHYGGLPASALDQMRRQSVEGFRSLESTHPILPDRLRAAYILGSLHPVAPMTATHAGTVYIVPKDAASAEETEKAVTRLMFK
ncbi:MAG TPA: M48 family metallopeptidase [Ktedonobacterales bacterium]|nr:M48 family metallopeptidase [Ktedonobacterales bacterium]